MRIRHAPGAKLQRRRSRAATAATRKPGCPSDHRNRGRSRIRSLGRSQELPAVPKCRGRGSVADLEARRLLVTACLAAGEASDERIEVVDEGAVGVAALKSSSTTSQGTIDGRARRRRRLADLDHAQHASWNARAVDFSPRGIARCAWCKRGAHRRRGLSMPSAAPSRNQGDE